MQKRHRVLKGSMVLLVAMATGCASAPGAAPGADAAKMPAATGFGLAGGNGLISNNASGLISNNAGGLISNNAGGLISNNAGGLISNNAGGLISNNAGGLISNNAGGLISNNAGGLTGAVRGPAAGLISNNAGGLISNNAGGLISNNAGGLISNNAGGLISNNAGGLISNNAGGLISNNAGGYKLLQAASGDGTMPVANCKVGVFNDRGEMISYSWVTTDEDGNYIFTALKASGPLLFVKAVYEIEGHQVVLVSTAPAPRNPGVINVAVNPATSLVAKKFSEMIRLNAVRPENLRPSTASKLAKALAPSLSARAIVAAAIFTDAKAASTFDFALDEAPAALVALIKSVATAANVASAVSDTPTGVLPPPAASTSTGISGSGNSGGTPAADPDQNEEFPVTSGLPGATDAPTNSGSSASNPDSSGTSGSGATNPTPDAPPVVSSLKATVSTLGVANGIHVDARPGSNDLFFPSLNGTTTSTLASLSGTLTMSPPGFAAIAVAFDGTTRYELKEGSITTSTGSTINIDNGVTAFQELAIHNGFAYVTSSLYNSIFKVDLSTGATTTFAGNNSNSGGFEEGLGTTARFKSPTGIVAAADGLFVADRGNSRIRKITYDGTVSTFSGGTNTGRTVNGSAIASRYITPQDIAIDEAGGFLYVTDQSANVIRQVSLADGSSLTVAGASGPSVTRDGVGPEAAFAYPSSVAFIKVGGTPALIVGEAGSKIRLVTGW